MGGGELESLLNEAAARSSDAKRFDPWVSMGQQAHDLAAPLCFGVCPLQSTDRFKERSDFIGGSIRTPCRLEEN